MADRTSAFARTVENIPIIGHFVSMCHGCAKKPAHAERAALKSTLGICLCICNFPTECVDECTRHKSPKLSSYCLTARPEWMRKYRHHSLRDLCLPGSHQSTTYHLANKLSSLPMASGWAKCQELTLSAQLRGGIRFLDLRLMTAKHGEIWTHHNTQTCLSLKEVLATVKAFIDDYPTEIIGMSLGNDGKELDWGNCSSLIHEYLGDRLIREHMKNMLLGDIIDQGKNVFVHGVPNVAFSWRAIHAHWPNTQWPSAFRENMETTVAERNESEDQTYFWYKAECTPGTHMIGRIIGGVPGAAFARCAEEKFDFTEDMAAAVNNIVYEILASVDSVNFNVVTTDFVQDEIVDRIIELNKINLLSHDQTLMSSAADQTLSREDVLQIPAVHHTRTSRMSTRSNQPLLLGSGRDSLDNSVSVSSSSTKPVPIRHSTSSRHNISIRSSRNTLTHNSTTGSVISGQFEMANRKAPPLEVKETTM